MEIRMIVLLIQDPTIRGGIEIKTSLVTGSKEYAESQIIEMIEYEDRCVVGWSLTDPLPVIAKR